MTERHHNDRLSAFHDGEAAGDEQAAVRRELESSTDSRRELADYKQLSNLLHDMPQEKLGAVFRSSVMQAIERSMLIPTADELASHRVAASAKSKWFSIAAALAASAAVLVIAVALLHKPHQPEIAATDPVGSASDTVDARKETFSPDSSFAGTEATRPKIAAPGSGPHVVSDESGVADISATDSKAATVAKSESGAMGGGDPNALKETITSNNLNDSHPIPGGAQPSISNSGFGQADVARPEQLIVENGSVRAQLEFRKDLKQAAVGDIVEALSQSGDRVAVVRLTVVDKLAGLEHLQVLLKENRIPVVNEADDANESAVSQNDKASDGNLVRDQKGAANNEQDLVCVLVDADTDQLSAALWNLREKSEFQQLRVEDEPLAMAELDSYVPSYAQQAQSGARAKSPPTVFSFKLKSPRRAAEEAEEEPEAAPADGSASTEKRQEVAKQAEAPPAAAAEPAEQTKDSKGDDVAEKQPDSSPAVPSQQVQVSIPERVLNRRNAEPEALVEHEKAAQQGRQQLSQRKAMKQAPTDASELAQQQPAEMKKSATQTQTRQAQSRQVRAVKVLLVLEDAKNVPAAAAPVQTSAPAPAEPAAPATEPSK